MSFNLGPVDYDKVAPETPDKWRKAWRVGFAPLFSDGLLWQLLEACETDDVRLTQGSTTTPPPLMCVADWPVEAACALGFLGACDNGGFDKDRNGKPVANCKTPATVGKAEEFFAKACFDADQRVGEPAACRWFLNWFDDQPREVMRAELAAEIRRELNRRKEAPAHA